MVPSVVQGGEQARGFVSTLNDPVQLQVQDLVAESVVSTTNVPGSAPARAPAPWLGASWSSSETLPALPPGVYTVSVPQSSLPPNEVYL